MAGLQLDVGGSSTSAANQSLGGNAGIAFAPRGIDTKMLAVIAAAAIVFFIVWKKGK